MEGQAQHSTQAATLQLLGCTHLLVLLLYRLPSWCAISQAMSILSVPLELARALPGGQEAQNSLPKLPDEMCCMQPVSHCCRSCALPHKCGCQLSMTGREPSVWGQSQQRVRNPPQQSAQLASQWQRAHAVACQSLHTKYLFRCNCPSKSVRPKPDAICGCSMELLSVYAERARRFESTSCQHREASRLPAAEIWRTRWWMRWVGVWLLSNSIAGGSCAPPLASTLMLNTGPGAALGAAEAPLNVSQ